MTFLALLDGHRAIFVVTGVFVFCRSSSSVKRTFLETLRRINAKFCGKVAINLISR